MYITKMAFTWKISEIPPENFYNIRRIDVIFDRENKNPLLIIDAGKIKIEDRTLEIGSEEVLKKVGTLDFEETNKYTHDEYCGDAWELKIDDRNYAGVISNPKFVNEIRKIIRLNAIQVYANKKLANYLK